MLKSSMNFTPRNRDNMSAKQVYNEACRLYRIKMNYADNMEDSDYFKLTAAMRTMPDFVNEKAYRTVCIESHRSFIGFLNKFQKIKFDSIMGGIKYKASFNSSNRTRFSA